MIKPIARSGLVTLLATAPRPISRILKAEIADCSVLLNVVFDQIIIRSAGYLICYFILDSLLYMLVPDFPFNER